MKRGRFVLVLVLAAASIGCSASVTLSGRLLQAPEQAAGDEAAQVQADQRLLEVFSGDMVKTEAALVALGVEPREAGRRVLAALQAAQAGRTPREDGR